MSAIGDYIHLTYTGYVKGPEQGSGRPPFFDNYGTALTAKQRQFQNWLKKQNSPTVSILEKETQKVLNLLKNFRDNRGNVSESDRKLVENILEDLWAQLDTKYLTLDKISAASAGLLQAGGFYVGQYTGESGGKQTVQTESISNINNQLQNLLDNTLNDLWVNIKNITEDGITLKRIEKEIINTQKNINDFIIKLQNQCKTLNVSDFPQASRELNSLFQNLSNSLKNNKNYDDINIEAEINTIAEGLNAGLAVNQYKGDISEALISVIAQRLVAVTGSSIEKAVVSGQERSKRGIDTKFFSPDIVWEDALEGKKFKQPFGNFIVSADAVQDKVDVKIETTNGRHAYISAKNYSSKSLARGVTNKSASFLTLIQNENQWDFINHYLNLNAVRGKNRRSIKSNTEEINSLLRQIVLAKLITGYNTITGENEQIMDSANVFVVFNSDNYTVKYYDMDDVLLRVIQKNRYKDLRIPVFFYNSNIMNATDYNTRISNLIKTLNVSVSYTLREEDYAKK